MTRTGIGKTEFKLTTEIFERLRAILRGSKDMPLEKFVQEVQLEFKQFTARTITDYYYIFSAASDYILDLYQKGQISLGLMDAICRGKSAPVMDLLAKDVIEKKMTTSQVCALKKILAKGQGKIPYHVALERATGKIPDFARPEELDNAEKSFGDIVANVTKQANRFYVAFKMAVDLLPKTILHSPQSYAELLRNVQQLDVVSEQWEPFIKQQKAKLIEIITRQAVTEAEMKEGGQPHAQA